MRRSSALAAAAVALLIAATAVLADDGPAISFSMTTQEVTLERANELALQIAQATSSRRPGADRPVLVPRHRPLPTADVATAGRPTPAPAAAPEPTAPPPSAVAPAPRRVPPARRQLAPAPATETAPVSAAPPAPAPRPAPVTSSQPRPQLPPMHPGVSRELLKDAKQALDRARPRGEGVTPR